MSQGTGQRDLFEKLRQQIPTLKGKPPLSNEFLYWHRELLGAVEAAFGQNSPELAEIRAFKFEVIPEGVELLADVLGDPEKLDEELKKVGKSLTPEEKGALAHLAGHPELEFGGLQHLQYMRALDKISSLLVEYKVIVSSRTSGS
jgi:hypothetical protein